MKKILIKLLSKWLSKLTNNNYSHPQISDGGIGDIIKRVQNKNK